MMQRIILAILGLVCLANAAITKHKLPIPFQHVARLQRSLQLVGEAISTHSQQARVKRDLSSVIALHCIQRCVQTMSNQMSSLGLSPDQNQGGILNPQLYQGTTFQDYCDTGLEGRDCIDQCTSGRTQSSLMKSMKDSMKTAFQAFEFLCVDHKDEFLSYMSCYRRSEDNVKETCTPKCGDAQEIAQQSQDEIKSAAVRGNINKISKILENLCVFLRCTMKCEATIITDVCDNRQPAALLYDFARTSIKSVENLIEKIPGASNLWPPTCRKIANGEALTNQIEQISPANEVGQEVTENDNSDELGENQVEDEESERVFLF